MGELADLIKHFVGNGITIIAPLSSGIEPCMSQKKMLRKAMNTSSWLHVNKTMNTYYRILAIQKNLVFITYYFLDYILQEVFVDVKNDF